jgi:hypothetical protein
LLWNLSLTRTNMPKQLRHPDREHAYSRPQASSGQQITEGEAVVVAEEGASEEMAAAFIAAIPKHRNWDREKMMRVDLRLVGPRRKSA